MKLRTKRDLIDSVAEYWKNSYYHPADQSKWEQTYQQLLALPKPATEEQIAAIVGRDSWVMTYGLDNTCMVCGGDHDTTVELAPENDECGTHRICPACVRE